MRGELNRRSFLLLGGPPGIPADVVDVFRNAVQKAEASQSYQQFVVSNGLKPPDEQEQTVDGLKRLLAASSDFYQPLAPAIVQAQGGG